ncbi:MAG: glycosyltransferase family 39 protein [Phycisphaerae bacterium]|nr:glycosyltransferase family 39 protein [Phycisphaerae bacterium]
MQLSSRGPIVMLLTAAVAAATMAVAGSWLGEGVDGPNASLAAWAVWFRVGSIALLWIGMALGFGGVLVDRLGLGRRHAIERVALEAALGVAASLALTSLFGTLGLLTAFGGIPSWGLVALGVGLLVLRLRSARGPGLRFEAPIPFLALGVPIGILLLAATSEPGWLWGSEFQGYDALSYHLQLPAEWLQRGRIETLPYNVYSAFPSFVESAFLQLFVLARGVEEGALAAQCLAALVTLLAALAVGCVARRLAGPVAGVFAAALYLSTPWIVVVGSLAYNDGFVGLFLASAILLALKPSNGTRPALRTGLALGLLVAAACGSKLTAVGFLALPVALVFLVLRGAKAVPIGAIAALVVAALLAPWLVRNGLATGNPTFPFLSGLFGTGHWTPEQAEIFAAAHSTDASLLERLQRLWNQWLVFGFGVTPAPGEPWAAQWSVLPWLGLAGLAALCAGRSRATTAVGAALLLALLAQLGFWIVGTHLQSRFLVPSAVLLAVAAAAALGHRRVASLAKPLTVMACALSLAPALVFRMEPSTDHSIESPFVAPALWIGQREAATGELFADQLAANTDPAVRQEILKSANPAFWINHYLPKETTAPIPIILVGDAAPFRYRRSYGYSTVWDRGAINLIAAQLPDNPELWATALAATGARFVLVHRPLLENWRAKGWLDPALTPKGIDALIASTRPVVQMANGMYIGALPAPPTQDVGTATGAPAATPSASPAPGK